MRRNPLRNNSKGINFFILILLFGFLNCSGNYYGIDGSDTLSREESIDRITTSQLIRFSNCNEPNQSENLLVSTALTNPRLTLDNAYYSKKDIEECEKAILLTPCNLPAHQCVLGPKEFLNGKLFQGGF